MYNIFVLHRNCTSRFFCLHVLKFSVNFIWISFNTLVLSCVVGFFSTELHILFIWYFLFMESLCSQPLFLFVCFIFRKSELRFVCKLQVFIPWSMKHTKVFDIIIARAPPSPPFLKVANCFVLINKKNMFRIGCSSEIYQIRLRKRFHYTFCYRQITNTEKFLSFNLGNQVLFECWRLSNIIVIVMVIVSRYHQLKWIYFYSL